jgi:hypothetical protein
MDFSLAVIAFQRVSSRQSLRYFMHIALRAKQKAAMQVKNWRDDLRVVQSADRRQSPAFISRTRRGERRYVIAAFTAR